MNSFTLYRGIPLRSPFVLSKRSRSEKQAKKFYKRLQSSKTEVYLKDLRYYSDVLVVYNDICYFSSTIDIFPEWSISGKDFKRIYRDLFVLGNPEASGQSKFSLKDFKASGCIILDINSDTAEIGHYVNISCKTSLLVDTKRITEKEHTQVPKTINLDTLSDFSILDDATFLAIFGKKIDRSDSKQEVIRTFANSDFKEESQTDFEEEEKYEEEDDDPYEDIYNEAYEELAASCRINY